MIDKPPPQINGIDSEPTRPFTRNGAFRHGRGLATATSLLTGLLLLAACSNPGEDVRVTLCKDLAAGQLDPPQSVTWKETRNDIHRAEYLAVNLRFEAQDRDGNLKPMRATCLYRHNAVDDTALTLADPLSAYSTSPYGMTLNGRTIGNPLLADAIKQAMLKQGRAFLESAQRGIEDVTESLQNRLRGTP